MIDDKIILFDMDCTLCDYKLAMSESMDKMKSPEEPTFDYGHDDVPDYIKERMDLVKSSVEWWTKIPRLQLGFDIWSIAIEFNLRRMILTQGPRKSQNAWTGKKIWIDENLGSNTEMTITRDKGLVYGKILVDDWPEYITNWLEWRPRGLVIMPASDHNIGFNHSQVIRYDGTNYREVREAIKTRMGC